MSVKDTVDKIRRGEVTSEQLVSSSLERIKSIAGYNAFISIHEESALKAAAAVDGKRSRGEPLGALAGIPVAIKDNITVSEGKTTCASRILEQFESPYDASAVAKLRQAEAVIIGKTNLDEFGMGSSTEFSDFGNTRNPHEPELIPGGSSGGSAAAVALGAVPLALGSDTGGSIRQPAACCGIVGMKPTYGRVSRYGLVAFASSLDQIGPLAGNVEDAAYLLNILAGVDEHDQTSSTIEVPDFTSRVGEDIKDKVLGVPMEYFGEGLDASIKSSILTVLNKLEKQGAVIREVSLPHMEYGVAAYYIIATAEASSNLSRYDGVRYSKRAKNIRNVAELFSRSRAQGFGGEVKKRIILGTYVLSSGFYDAYYLRAQKVRRKITDDFNAAFESCDVVITPTAPVLPVRQGTFEQDQMAAYLGDVYTVGVNLSGLPGISIPAGKIGNLYAGLQVIGKPFAEEEVFQVAAAVEELSR
jgi:aspartyl-tRNA(Asn)/glutamyl-tRNA(Gln) amidotransferase subunit A